ncbi:hypothetical protein BDB00DRAFT_878056 [Zychaea mexicana]|uniref:uncharacterized protein n=1 Tax=Zychaea mexicana TaxID=64656 RepID=UPI0022FF0793|nr:uncharacterized protein BDB00DRAFT_878056 [Zychaea mexicana]KAI9485122.1 hypothetical protein BDB00DRAFT_878056 [Zychaea mexicana]
MAGTKRTKGSFDNEDYFDNGSSSKRVRFKNQPQQRRGQRESSSSDAAEDFEFDHEDALEPVKKRRGAVNTEELSDDEEVGGGAYSSDSDGGEDSDQEKNKGKKVAATAEDDDFDMFADTAPAETQPQKSKGSKGKRLLELGEIEGQELDSRDVNSGDEEGNQEPKLTAFNMRQEMEEGSFDQQGNYHINKTDPQAYHDRWMEGVSRKDMAMAKDAQVRREQEEALKEAERQANVPQTKTDVYRELVKYLKPGENVNQAIGKLGGGSSLTAKMPKWKQKLMEKKNRNKKQQQKQGSEEEEAERQRKVMRLTELADQMMAFGHFGVYEDTFEEMVVHLRRAGAVPSNWMPGDDDNDNTSNQPV